ncbi:MAG: cytochrome c biogenesis protein CcsA [Armatimonadetes bacterium]|nr:cytochrome c biogenesis protein CcsA [Armatimonadota bacterium]
MNPLNPTGLPDPPSWSLLVGTIGQILVLAAAGMFAVSGLAWVMQRKWALLVRVGGPAFSAGCAALIGAFVSLGVLFANNRFEYSYVYGHADTHNALAYRIAGIWSGQEGSFLLWATTSSIFGLLTVGRSGVYRRWYTVAFSFFLGGIASILAFESPFKLNLADGHPFVPPEGLGLAPSLQNYWVVIHPPTIFLGFGSLTALFAIAFAAMAEGQFEDWIKIVRPWAITSLTLVGLGLCMGGFWAYETLGWGGFWMWDPVENVSFVPWCFAIAFVHGVIVQAAKGKWQVTNLLLGGLPFLTFVYGTFLTRSGFLSEASVHSFAEMDHSALKLLLVVMVGATLGFLGLWVYRMAQGRRRAAPSEHTPGLGREGFYIIGITTLVMLGIATMLGMSVPFFMALNGQKPRVVEEGTYHQVLSWIFVPLMLMMAIAPFVSWRGMTLKELGGRIYTLACVTVGLTGLGLFLVVSTPFGKKLELAPTVHMLGRYEVNGLAWIVFLVGICTFVLVSNAWRIGELFKRSKLGIAPFVAHLGVGVLMAGLIASRGFEQKGRSMVMEDHPARLLGYEVRYLGMTSNEHDRDNKLKLAVYKDGASQPLFTARPGLYKIGMADGQENTMVWPHIEHGPLMDTYVSLGQPQTDAGEEISLPVGSSQPFGGLTLTYQKMVRQGEFGQVGTKFGAQVRVEAGGQSKIVTPTMEIGEDGRPVFHPAPISEHMQLVMAGMNAADKSVRLQVQLTTPIYPIEIYNKPMTTLVWWGTALMTLGGFGSALYRRSPAKSPSRVKAPSRQRPRTPELATTRTGETR